MEFWAAEVKSGEAFKVQPGDGFVIHLSQANLGEIKKDKGSESVCLFVNVDEKKLVLGTLSSDKLPQQQFDLVFDRDFELSHNWKGGSIYYYGYRALNPVDEDDEGRSFGGSESEEDTPLTLETNGKPEVKAKEEKPSDAKKVSASKKVDSDDSMSDDDDSSDEEDDEDSDSDDEDDSEEETPVKVEPVKKKRTSDAEPETPAASKKVKVTTPQKTDGKKGGAAHVATPHPAKQAGKTPATSQSQKTPKSGGSHVCNSCSKTFGSEGGLDSHTKAKHTAAK